jgi:hypothetical protein
MKRPKFRLNQSGVSHIILPVIIAAVIAVAGYYAFLAMHTANLASSKTATTCVKPTTYPAAPNGGMTYVNWTFNHAGISSLTSTISVANNPGSNTELFLQLYDHNIDNTAQYYGLQTSGLALWSQFGTNNTANVAPGPGSTVVVGNNEGAYVSLRHNFGSLPTGKYTTKVYRTTSTATGDWFAYYVTFPGKSATYIGSILFPRAVASVPASFKDGGGTWIEDYQNNGTTLYPVPLWNVTVGIVANSTVAPVHAVSAYSAMPNSNIKLSTAKGHVNMVMGGSTPRCNPAGQLF